MAIMPITFAGSPAFYHVPHICGLIAGGQMRWIAAGWIVARMTDESSVLNHAVRYLVGDAMRERLNAQDIQIAISALKSAPIPRPAFIGSADLYF